MEIVSTKVVKFSELESLIDVNQRDWHHQIPVKKSDHPRCIYNVFKDMDGTGLLLQLSKIQPRSSFGLSTFGIGSIPKQEFDINAELYDLNPKHEHWRKDFTGIEPIEIIVDEKVQVQAIEGRGNHHHTPQSILIKGEKRNLNVEISRTAIGKIEEKDGKFYTNHQGVLFNLELYDSGRPDNSVETTLYKIRWIDDIFENRDQKNRLLMSLSKDVKFDIEKTEGITKTLAVVKPFYDELVAERKDFLAIAAFKYAAEASKRTVSNVKFSVIFNKIFSTITTKEDFYEKVKTMSLELEKEDQSYSSDDNRNYFQRVMDSIPEARDIKKAALKRKSTGAINKIMDDLDFINIDKDKYPLTHEAIFSGEIPKGTFFRKNGDSYFVYNDNWELWEEMLASHYDVAKAIAEEASRRTTYEKDLMSYFFFVLHKLPEYLERQTGKKWKGIPKLVDSENELDPPTEGSNGVSKQRSALTPIVDNEKNEIVIPYVSMRLSGYQTTYCYGLDYNVLERGMSFMGNSVTKDVEKDLNGRDDYGLMFYTLTGSHNGRGYPTFLIIFEHLDKTTKVHFHRTHPMRSKAGDYNPIHGWTVGCYKWMVGNVNFERIKAQQGDLVFVEANGLAAFNMDDDKKDSVEFTKVNAYDNHIFESPVLFLPYTKKEKSNILGYFKIEKDTMLNHHEHKPRLIPAGDYELRQCRSWEANPKGIWSLRID